MRGLKLLIRPLASDDQQALSEFYQQEAAREPNQDEVSLVAKLLGRIVAHATARPERDELRISSIYVARELRRKGIGRAVAIQLQQIAADSGTSSVVVAAGTTIQFFKSLGFIERDGTLRKVIV